MQQPTIYSRLNEEFCLTPCRKQLGAEFPAALPLLRDLGFTVGCGISEVGHTEGACRIGDFESRTQRPLHLPVQCLPDALAAGSQDGCQEPLSLSVGT